MGTLDLLQIIGTDRWVYQETNMLTDYLIMYLTSIYKRSQWYITNVCIPEALISLTSHIQVTHAVSLAYILHCFELLFSLPATFSRSFHLPMLEKL